MTWIKAVAPKMLHDKFGVYLGQWMPEMDRCWMDFDRGYQVCSRMINTKQFGTVEHVTITRLHENPNEFSISSGGSAAIGWSEKMMIKDELFGEDRFAIEVYPKKENLIDVSDVYHLWVFNKKYDMPFGIHPRECSKAINRGALPLSREELDLLQSKYDEAESKTKLVEQ